MKEINFDKLKIKKIRKHYFFVIVFFFFIFLTALLRPTSASALTPVPLTGTPVWSSIAAITGFFLIPGTWYDANSCANDGTRCFVVPSWRERIDYFSGAPRDINNDTLYIPPGSDGAYWFWWHNCDAFVANSSGGSVATLNQHCGGKPYSAYKDNGNFYINVSYAFSTMAGGGGNLYGNIQGPKAYAPGVFKEHLCLGYGSNPTPGNPFTAVASQVITCKAKTLTICPGMALPVNGTCPATPTPTPTPTPSPTPTPGTLTATISTNPSSGVAPLMSRLVATAGGTQTGTVNYTFWYNCNQGGNSISSTTAFCGSPTQYGEKHDGVNSSTYTTALHQFYSAGTYHVKVIVERGNAVPAFANFDLVVTAPVVYTLDITGLTATPNAGVQPLSPSLTLNYHSDRAGPWDVYVYCKTANTSADTIYLNKADTGVGAAPGHSPPWYSASISVASGCAYTGNNYGNISLRVVMKNSAVPATTDSATVSLAIEKPTSTVTVVASGTGATAAIRAQFASNLPSGPTMTYTMYCDKNDTSTVVSSGWDLQATNASRDMSLGNCNYLAAGQQYYPKVIVAYPGFPNVQATTVYNYQVPASLSASLEAAPNPAVTGRSVTLTAKRSGGTATGPLNYSIYCKNTDANPTATFTNIPSTTTSEQASCTYTTAGSYIAKTVITQQGVIAQATTSLSIGPPTVSVSLSASPSSPAVGQSVSLSAVVSGTAQGNITYDFYCLDTNATYSKRVVNALTSFQAEGLCQYNTAGSFKAKVVATRESIVAQSKATIAVSSSGINGQIIFEEGGDPIKIRGSLVANTVVFAAREKGTQKYSARIFSDKGVLSSRLPGFSDIMSIISGNQ